MFFQAVKMPVLTHSKSAAAEHLATFSKMIEAAKKRSAAAGSVSGNKELDKMIQVLSTITDISFLGAQSAQLHLFDANWLVSAMVASSPSMPSSLWTLLATLNRWCLRFEEARLFLRDRVRYLPTLTKVLLALPATTVEKRSKLMDYMRTAAVGIRIGRMEAFVMDLVPKLVE
jgi:hypothetical protein